MKLFQVDAFTDKLFQGNPAAVVPLSAEIPVKLMQAIAAENYLAETAFVRHRADGAWDLRWFTPVCEVPFCGHATLAAAHVLSTEYGAPHPLRFHTQVGLLSVTEAEGFYLLDLPRLDPEPLETLPDEVAQGIFAEVKARFKTFENIFVELENEEAVRSFEPDLARLARLGRTGLVITSRSSDGKADFVSRYFAPGAGIPEDHVTGSIHTTLTPYWADKLGKPELLAFQASERGGWLRCALQEDRVHIRGQAVTYLRGELDEALFGSE